MKTVTTLFAFALCLSLAAGCSNNTCEELTMDYEVYVDTIRDYALMEDTPDNLLYFATATTEERASKYEVAFVDAMYVSYYCKEYSYVGGAHGTTTIYAGTISRKTGKKLELSDIFPKDKQAALHAELKNLVTQKLSPNNQILFDALLTENFYLKEDGWHFVYNPYDIAAYAAGVTEVVIPKSWNQ